MMDHRQESWVPEGDIENDIGHARGRRAGEERDEWLV
jgi:hypothetical protein